MSFYIKTIYFIFFVSLMLVGCETVNEIHNNYKYKEVMSDEIGGNKEIDNSTSIDTENNKQSRETDSENTSDNVRRVKNIYFFVNLSKRIKFNGKNIFDSTSDAVKKILDSTDDFFDSDEYLSSDNSDDKLLHFKEYKDTIIGTINKEITEKNIDELNSLKRINFIQYSPDQSDDINLLIIKIGELDEGEYNLIKNRPTKILFEVNFINNKKINLFLFKKRFMQKAGIDYPFEKGRAEEICISFLKYFIKFCKHYFRD